MIASDNFMSGWEARREALRAPDKKAQERIKKDHSASMALVERVMTELHDASQDREDGP